VSEHVQQRSDSSTALIARQVTLFGAFCQLLVLQHPSACENEHILAEVGQRQQMLTQLNSKLCPTPHICSSLFCDQHRSISELQYGHQSSCLCPETTLSSAQCVLNGTVAFAAGQCRHKRKLLTAAAVGAAGAAAAYYWWYSSEEQEEQQRCVAAAEGLAAGHEDSPNHKIACFHMGCFGICSL
jgi:hypothetical protein